MCLQSNSFGAGRQFRLINLNTTKLRENVYLFLVDMKCVFRVSLQLFGRNVGSYHRYLAAVARDASRKLHFVRVLCLLLLPACDQNWTLST